MKNLFGRNVGKTDAIDNSVVGGNGNGNDKKEKKKNSVTKRRLAVCE